MTMIEIPKLMLDKLLSTILKFSLHDTELTIFLEILCWTNSSTIPNFIAYAINDHCVEFA